MFATKNLGYSSLVSHGLLSLYSIGSISGVIVMFILLKLNVTETKLLVVTNTISLIALLTVTNASTVIMTSIGCFVFGFTAAGGVMQIALNVLLKMFPTHKGVITGTYFTFGSIATFTIPIVTGILSQTSIQAVMNFDVVIGLVGTGLVIITSLAIGTGNAFAHAGHSVMTLLHIGGAPVGQGQSKDE